MKIALLGGNGYQYAFAPSYAQANGRGYITQNELMGQDQGRSMTPKEAYEAVKYYKSQGWDNEITDEMNALARQYRANKAASIVDSAGNIIGDVSDAITSIFGAKKQTSETQTQQQALAAQQSRDNTALIVTGAVAGVALLAVSMSKKKGRRR